jgi:hypothetical protein
MAIQISDLTKQGQSAQRSGWVDNGHVLDLALCGSTVYAVDDIGMISYNVSTPTSPVFDQFWNIPGTPTGAASNGPYGFSAAGSLGFHLVLAGMPYVPMIAWDGGETSAGLNVAVKGTWAFMTVGAPSTPGIQAYDITDPENPIVSGFTPLASPNGIFITGDYAFVANGSTIKILDIRNPALPLPEVGSADSKSGTMSNIAVSGDLAFIIGTRLQCYDVSDPANPAYRGMHDADGVSSMGGVAGRGTTAYVSEGAYFQPNGLKLVDLSNPELPVLDGKAAFGMQVESLALEGTWAFVTDSFPDAGLWAVDIDPTSPNFLHSYGPCDVAPGTESGWAEQVTSYGGWAYVTFNSMNYHAMSIVDVADPSALDATSLKNTLPLGGTPHGITMSGKWAFVANGSLGLQVIQVAP